MAGKCAKCERVLSTVNLKAITVRAPGTTWKGVSYECPYCSSILSVGIDPIAVKTDVVAEVLQGLKKMLR